MSEPRQTSIPSLAISRPRDWASSWYRHTFLSYSAFVTASSSCTTSESLVNYRWKRQQKKRCCASQAALPFLLSHNREETSRGNYLPTTVDSSAIASSNRTAEHH